MIIQVMEKKVICIGIRLVLKSKSEKDLPAKEFLLI
jgi:hypothetical protein